jgi:hypothetical protein
MFSCYFTGEHGAGAYNYSDCWRLYLDGVLAVKTFLSFHPDAWCRFLVVQEGFRLRRLGRWSTKLANIRSTVGLRLINHSVCLSVWEAEGELGERIVWESWELLSTADGM